MTASCSSSNLCQMPEDPASLTQVRKLVGCALRHIPLCTSSSQLSSWLSSPTLLYCFNSLLTCLSASTSVLSHPPFIGIPKWSFQYTHSVLALPLLKPLTAFCASSPSSPNFNEKLVKACGQLSSPSPVWPPLSLSQLTCPSHQAGSLRVLWHSHTAVHWCIPVILPRESLFLFSAGESLLTLWDSGLEWDNFLVRPPRLPLGRGKSFPQSPWNTTHYVALSNMHFDDFFISLYLLANYKLFWSRAPVFFIFVPVAPSMVFFYAWGPS